MPKKFEKLRAAMSPQAQNRAEAKMQEMLEEMSLKESLLAGAQSAPQGNADATYFDSLRANVAATSDVTSLKGMFGPAKKSVSVEEMNSAISQGGAAT